MPLLRFFGSRQRFQNPGVLRDGDLELVQPSHEHAPAFLRAVQHPECAADPECAITPTALQAFLEAHPNGLERPDFRRSRSPAYRFWMQLHEADGLSPPLPFGGTISLRIGNDENTRLYYGHVGYLVFPPARGRHYSERAVRLLLPLARRHGMPELWITTNPDNVPSRRTCERLGCELVEIIDLPQGHPLWRRGERRKCRYRLPLST